MKNVLIILCCIILFSCNQASKEKRITLSLNGTWDVEATVDSVPPTSYRHKIPVPGLMDLATPSIPNCGYKYLNYYDEDSGDSTYQYEYFWYKKEILLGKDQKQFSILKIHKALFGHAVFVNGHYVGKYDFCFI